MRKVSLIAAALGFAAVPLVFAAQQAQSPPPPTPQKQESVADAARKAREQKKKEAKPPHVFTNDDLLKTENGVSVVGSAPTAASEAGKPEQAVAPKETKALPKDEAGWRAAFAQARAQLHRDQLELSVLQRELAQLQVQYYPDPTKALQEQYSRKEINEKTEKIAAKQKDIEQDQQAISDLEEKLRQTGGDAAWSRE